jgi:SAM domain (Sterile alpha motif)
VSLTIVKGKSFTGTLHAKEALTISSWLTELGLSKYVDPFLKAGYDDLSMLSDLHEADLLSIEKYTASHILPGHRKKILSAARQLYKVLACYHETEIQLEIHKHTARACCIR